MAVALDTTSNAGAGFGTTSPITWSHTCTGSNLILWVAITVHGSSSNAVTAVSYNSVAMTQAAIKTDATNGITTYLYYLVAPATGAHTVSVTWTTGSGKALAAAAASFTGASQTGVPDATAVNNGTTAPQPSVSTTTVANNAWIVNALGVNDDSLVSAGAGQTKIADAYDGGGSFPAFGMGYQGPITPAGATTSNWTGTVSTDAWVNIAASFKPAVVAATPTASTLLSMGVG